MEKETDSAVSRRYRAILIFNNSKFACKKKIAYLCTVHLGEMAEWSIAAVLKTVEGHTSGGSNPSLSAINAENQQIAKQTPNFTPKNVKLGVFVLFKKLRGTLAPL